MGEAETFNFSIAVLPEDIVLFHSLYRTSVIGRKDLIKLAFSDNNKKSIDAIPSAYTSRVIEIFNTTLKVLGIRIDFVEDEEKVKILNNEILSAHKLNDKTFMCTDYEFYLIETVDDMRARILEKYPVITRKELSNILNKMISDNPYLSEGMSKDLYKLVKSYNTKELENVQISIGEEVNKFDGVNDVTSDNQTTLNKEVTCKEKPEKKTSIKKKVNAKDSDTSNVSE